MTTLESHPPDRPASATSGAPTFGEGARRRLVVTQGDPRGIGPELLLRLAAEGAWQPADVIVADPDHLAHLAATLEPTWAAVGWAKMQSQVIGGRGLTQVAALAQGVDHVLAACERGEEVALVTAPIDKAACRAEGFAYPGHTEYLAARAGGAEVAMLMAGPRLRVVLATIHLPLAEVPVRLSMEGILLAGTRLAEGLPGLFGVARPRIGVLGLNPHAGERGMLGQEEFTCVTPAIEALRRRFEGRATFAGPLPADTAFHAHLEGSYDGLVAMYHDQGLGPFKLLHFHDGVNVTLGLPFVRTSPDHGTARDLAGTGRANPASLWAAVRLARGHVG